MNILIDRPELGKNRVEVIGGAIYPDGLPSLPASRPLLVQGLGIFPRSAVRPLSAAEIDTLKMVVIKQAEKAAATDNSCFDDIFSFPSKTLPVAKSVRPGEDAGMPENAIFDSVMPFNLTGRN
jgi:hypothetical protein